MNLNDYQREARGASTHSIEPSRETIEYAALGIAGEAGELANMAKKQWRDAGSIGSPIPPGRVQDMVLELGDILWYVAHAATVLGVTLEKVAAENLKKLEARRAARYAWSTSVAAKGVVG